jgi:low affinity Fe/Cu permease
VLASWLPKLGLFGLVAEPGVIGLRVNWKVDGMARVFTRFAEFASWLAGHYLTSLLAMLVIVVWLVIGPIVRFSDTWLLFMGTATSIVAFLMVFLIQHTQNRDAVAVHLKLNELLRAVEGANTALIRVENEPDEEMKEYKRLYIGLCEERDSLKALLEQQGGGADRNQGSGAEATRVARAG